MGQTPAPIPQLNYAPASTADGVRIDRRIGGMTIEMGAPRRRVMRLLVMTFVLLAISGGFAYQWFSADKADESLKVASAIAGVLICGGLAVPLLKRLHHLLRPITIEVDSHKVVYSRRMGDRIGRDEWPRDLIRGLRVTSQGWNEVLSREKRLTLWFSNARGAVLLDGPKNVVMAVSDALSDALGYQREIATSLVPVRASRRLTMQRYPGMVEFVLRRPPLSWLNLILLLPALALAVGFEYLLEGRGPRFRSASASDLSWLVAQMTAFVLIAWTLLVAGLNSFSRRKVLSVVQGQLILIERSLVRPLHERWSLGYAKHFDVHQTGNQRAALSMTMLDGSQIEVLTDENPSDLAWIRDRLAELLHGAAIQAIKPQYVEPPREVTTIRLDGKSG